jgi:hypothetical protein
MQEGQLASLIVNERTTNVVLHARGQVTVGGLDQLSIHQCWVTSEQFDQVRLCTRLIEAEAKPLQADACTQGTRHHSRSHLTEAVSAEIQVDQRVVDRKRVAEPQKF